MGEVLNTIEIFIARSDDDLTSAELKQELERLSNWDPSIRLDAYVPAQEIRTVDPTVLRVLVSSGALRVLVAGIFQIAQTRGRQKVAIQFPDGTVFEYEGRNPIAAVEKVLPKLQPQTIITI